MADTVEIWPIGTDAKVLISGITDDAGAFINDATVTGILKDASGNPVTNASALTFTYITASSGNYSGIIPYNADLLDGRVYTLVLTVVDGGAHALINITRNAGYNTL